MLTETKFWHPHKVYLPLSSARQINILCLARKWAKKDKFDVSVLLDWISEINYIVSGKIKTLQKRIKQPPHPVHTNPEVISCLQHIHEKYVFAPADKAANRQFRPVGNKFTFCYIYKGKSVNRDYFRQTPAISTNIQSDIFWQTSRFT